MRDKMGELHISARIDGAENQASKMPGRMQSDNPGFFTLGNLGTRMLHKTAWRFGTLPTPEVGETPCAQHRRSGDIIAHAYSTT